MNEEIIRKVLVDLEIISPIKKIKKNTLMVDLGIDSMGLLALITELEEYYDVYIPDDELLLENFYSVDTICNVFNNYIGIKNDAD